MRKPLIAGNWKMNLLPSDGKTLVLSLWEELSDYEGAEVVVCPPYTAIPALAELFASTGIRFGLGAQNMHWENSGAYTGEISPPMLVNMGVSHVILGHSERRQLFGEYDQGVNRKVKAALENGIAPILCCGETLKQRQAGEMENVVSNQVRCGLFELPAERVEKIVVAYEPIWAIGTGVAATAEDAAEVCSLIRNLLHDEYGSDTAETVRILYGGSVTPDNISGLMSKENIDGALVGGASLKADDFQRIVRGS